MYTGIMDALGAVYPYSDRNESTSKQWTPQSKRERRAHAMVDMSSLGNQAYMWWWVSLLVLTGKCLYNGCDGSAMLC